VGGRAEAGAAVWTKEVEAMSETPREPTVKQALGRLGLSHAALTASIDEELDQAGIGEIRMAVASAVAHAIEANNAEVLRQLTAALRDLERYRPNLGEGP
jgi:hypothetical protein